MIENTPEISRNHQITFPFGRDEFKEFIKSLLGKPQSTGFTVDERFLVERGNIEDIITLIEQRIEHQHKYVTVSREIDVYFDDNNFVKFKSVEEFLTYRYLNSASTESLSINLIYLIEFSDKRPPEKQEITIHFTVNSVIKNRLPGILTRKSYELSSIPDGLIYVIIEHTNRSWSNDIENILRTHLHSFTHRKKGLKSYIERKSAPIAIFSTLFLLCVSMASSYYFLYTQLNDSIIKGKLLINSDEFLYSEKLNFLIDLFTSSVWSNSGMYLFSIFFISLIISIVFGAMVGNLCNPSIKSHIIYTKEDKENYDSALNGSSRKIAKILIGAIGSLVISIASNYIFVMLIQT